MYFETNSSSVYSISIAKDITTLVGHCNKYTINGNDKFGCENTWFNDTQTKLEYLWQCINYYPVSHLDIDEGVKILQSNLDKLRNAFASWGMQLSCNVKVIKDKTEWCTTEYAEYRFVLSEEGRGYLDHDGQAKYFVDDMLDDNDKLYKYLFDCHSYVITGNDNESDYAEVPEYIDCVDHWNYEKGN